LAEGGTWKYHWDLQTEKYWYGPYGGPDSEIGNVMRVLTVRRSVQEMARIAFDVSTPISLRDPLKPGGEVVVHLIDAIYNGKPSDSYLQIPTSCLPSPSGKAFESTTIRKHT
jgi:alpha-galactosidase